MTPTSVVTDTPSRSTADDQPKLGPWERISFACIHGLLSALLACVSLSGLYRIGRMFGTAEWAINFKRRRRFARAMERVLGRKPAPSERRRATREFFMYARCDRMFYLIVDRIPRAEAAALMTIENEEVLDAAIARGRGVYMAMSHHGPQHLAAMFMALKGHKVAGVRDRREGGIRRYVQDRFDRRYPDFQRMRVLFADSYPRDVYRCFNERYLIGSTMDIGRIRDARQKVEEVVIFGERRRFLSGPLRVAIRCGAPALQAFIIPLPGFRYRLDIVGTLVDPDEVRDEDETVARAIQTYAANVERYIRTTPALMTRI